jgi:hypothetical protein
VAAGLAAYLDEHIAEESGEDILPDLALMGVDVPALLKRPAPPLIAALIGSQYFWIMHCHPIALLGYLEALEGNMASPDAVEALIARTGYPRAAYTQLLEHAERDIGHGAELHAVLDRLPLGPEHHELLGLSALQTVHLACRALEEVFAQHERAYAATAGARAVPL